MTPEERNTQTFSRLIAAADAGDLETVDACFAPGYVDHDASEVRRHGVSDRDGARRAFEAFLEAFPDVRHTIHDLIAQGDRIAARLSAEGTHLGTLEGVAPTGRRVRTESIVIYRFEDGRIAERWCRGDRTVLEQLRETAEASP